MWILTITGHKVARAWHVPALITHIQATDHHNLQSESQEVVQGKGEKLTKTAHCAWSRKTDDAVRCLAQGRRCRPSAHSSTRPVPYRLLLRVRGAEICEDIVDHFPSDFFPFCFDDRFSLSLTRAVQLLFSALASDLWLRLELGLRLSLLIAVFGLALAAVELLYILTSFSQ